MDCESAMYSASVVDHAIFICIFDVQCIGHTAQVVRYPILDLAEQGSSDAVLLFHSEACAESTHQSMPSWFGLIISPLSAVPNMYYPILLTAMVCCIFGLAQCLAH
jgi:hypothetical protein